MVRVYLTNALNNKTVSLNIVYTEDSINEINDLLDNKIFYITPDGEVTYSVISETLKYVVGYMSRKPKLSKEDEEEYIEISTEDADKINMVPILDDGLIDGYHISNMGSVYRIHKGKVKELKLHTTKLGYVEAILTRTDGNKKHLQVHRLVAIHFLAPPESEDMKDVNHKDGDRSNNVEDNVEWMTHSDNVKHSYRELRGK